MITTVLAAADRVAMPWKNGGGVTREIAAWPVGSGLEDFDWRISMAEVRKPGAFSLFPDVDRVLTVLEGRLALTFAGEKLLVLGATSEPLSFPGDRPCWGEPVGKAVLDLNVMVRRGGFRCQVERVSNTQWRPTGDVAVLIALEPLSVVEQVASDSRSLGTFDGLFCTLVPAHARFQVGGCALGVSISAK
ncbi:hypothetical protein BH10PSE2_BH10PSE2_03690 [soil metagenome]